MSFSAPVPCEAWARGEEGELKRWATVGLASDGADFVTGLRSKPLVGSKKRADRHALPGALCGGRDPGSDPQPEKALTQKASANDAVMIPPGANGQPTAIRLPSDAGTRHFFRIARDSYELH